jgi:hypothetical protein
MNLRKEYGMITVPLEDCCRVIGNGRYREVASALGNRMVNRTPIQFQEEIQIFKLLKPICYDLRMATDAEDQRGIDYVDCGIPIQNKTFRYGPYRYRTISEQSVNHINKRKHANLVITLSRHDRFDNITYGGAITALTLLQWAKSDLWKDGYLYIPDHLITLNPEDAI